MTLEICTVAWRCCRRSSTICQLLLGIQSSTHQFCFRKAALHFRDRPRRRYSHSDPKTCATAQPPSVSRHITCPFEVEKSVPLSFPTTYEEAGSYTTTRFTSANILALAILTYPAHTSPSTRPAVSKTVCKSREVFYRGTSWCSPS